ncbi:MAG: AI-2E family transporter [Coriobacteriales bacterium]|nr:AI-2E family transporter [Coriobacteriales bacterium]
MAIRNSGIDIEGTESTPKGMRRLTRDLRFVWTIIGVLILLVCVGFVFKSLATAIYSIVIAGLIIFILKGSVAWLTKKHIKRGIATTIMIVVLLFILAAIGYSFVPMLVEQTSGFIQSLPDYVNGIESWWKEFVATHRDLMSNDIIQSLAAQIWGGLQGIVGSITKDGAISGIFGIGISVANVAIILITAFVIAFWILIDYDKVTHEIHIIAGPKSEWYLILFSTMLSRVLGGFIKGTLIAAIIDAAIMSIIFAILGMPFWLVLGIFAGILTIIPYIGSIIAAITFTTIGFFVSPVAVIVSLLASVLMPWVIHTFVSPKIMSSTINLHPGLTMVAIIVGLALDGAVGMVIAIPLFAFLRDVFVYFFESLTGRQLVTVDGAMFKGDASDYFDPVYDATNGALTGIMLTQMIESNEERIYSNKEPSHSAAARRAKAHKQAQAERPITFDELIGRNPAITGSFKKIDSEPKPKHERRATKVEEPPAPKPAPESQPVEPQVPEEGQK